MGILEHVVTKVRRSLASHSLIGRAPGSILRIEDPRVSAEHARVFWNKPHWEVRDLGSSNGTMVDGRRLAPGERVVLHEGSELRLAGGERWVLVDALPPVASARSVSGQVRVPDEGLLIVPNAASPVVCAYEDADGLWWVEVGEETRPAIDQETFLAGEPWVLSIPPVLPGPVQTTVKVQRPLEFADVTLRFGVSTDEEHTVLWIVHEDVVKPIKSRAYIYSLLVLARSRLKDRERGDVPPSEHGWVYVEDLLRMLQTDAEKLNVDIFRARQHLAQLGLMDSGTIVQRRTGTRQIRLGTDRIEIVSA